MEMLFILLGISLTINYVQLKAYFKLDDEVAEMREIFKTIEKLYGSMEKAVTVHKKAFEKRKRK